MTDVIIQHLITEQKGMLVQAILLCIIVNKLGCQLFLFVSQFASSAVTW